MTAYVEKYEVPGEGFYGIEDFEDGAPPAKHFQSIFRSPRFRVWRFRIWHNGCGIGGLKSLEDSRAYLTEVISSRLVQKIGHLEVRLAEARANLDRLSAAHAFMPPRLRRKPRGLQSFRVKEFVWEKEERERKAHAAKTIRPFKRSRR